MAAVNIPHFWAEARLQVRKPDRQVTVRRWGWSDVSQEAAEEMAGGRAREALDRILAGEPLRRREARESYGTGEGLPIREELVSRHEHAVITRNSYGSLCLNTPDVLFADVDAPWRGALEVPARGCLALVLAGIALGFVLKSAWIGAALALGGPWIWSWVVGRLNRARRPAGEAAAKERSLAAIRSFAAARPDWLLRVYETPAGYRLLAMHDVFDPQGEAASEAFEAVNADPRFSRLCALQSCFRARVSPKYWRMRYQPKESLPKSKWPFPPEHLPRRRKWIEGYEALAPGFASCRFIECLGSGRLHPRAEAVRELHDRLCQADRDLPLA
jgi:hypothetical protein